MLENNNQAIEIEQQPPRDLKRAGSIMVLAAMVLFAVVLLRRAWLSDDAFITLRTVDNFVNGYGLTWNPGERVQSYTHPLWMLLLTSVYTLTREPVYTTLFLGVAISLAAAVLFSLRVASSTMAAAFGLLLMILSKGFMDYSTSGLENPLTNLLLVSFFAVYFGRKPSVRTVLLLSLISSLVALNRLDALLLCLPALLYAFVQVRSARGLLALVAGQLPLLLWLGFATIYYGFPFPNTAYAKLNTGVPVSELTAQGFYYFINSLEVDPITLATILLGLGAAVFSREKAQWVIAAGIVLYLVYVVRIGGDFMSGRMLTAPFLVAVVLVARLDFRSLSPVAGVAALALLVLVGLAAPMNTLSNSAPPLNSEAALAYLTGPNSAGITDERLVYSGGTGLLVGSRAHDLPDHNRVRVGKEFRAQGPSVQTKGAVGMIGYYAGPQVHIIDVMALTEPLLARLPAFQDVNWRIGHFERVIPEGYQQTLETGQNLIADENLARYYDKLLMITSGSLFDGARLREIWRMNTGAYQDLIDTGRYRYPNAVQKEQQEVSRFIAEGTALDDSRLLHLGASGLQIDLDTLSHGRDLEVSINNQLNRYQVVFERQGTEIGRLDLSESYLPAEGGLHVQTIVTPEHVARQGYDRIRILPAEGTDFSVGHVRIWGPEEWPECGQGHDCTIEFGDQRIVQLLDQGWSSAEDWGIWSDGPQSTMQLLAGQGNYQLDIEAFPQKQADGQCDQALEVWWNEFAIGEQSFIGCESQLLSFNVPQDVVTDGVNDLRFAYRYALPPQEASQVANGDQRMLGVGFRSLHLSPARGLGEESQ